jgi:hypothetical protein
MDVVLKISTSRGLSQPPPLRSRIVSTREVQQDGRWLHVLRDTQTRARKQCHVRMGIF